MAEWLRHPPVETLVVTGSDSGLAKNVFLHFFLTKMNTVHMLDLVEVSRVNWVNNSDAFCITYLSTLHISHIFISLNRRAIFEH